MFEEPAPKKTLLQTMNIKSEWDSPSGNNDDGDEEEEDRLPTMKRRQFSLQQRIQQWKRQRQSITVTDYQQVLGRFQQEGEEEEEEDGEDVKPTEMKLIQLLCDRTAFRLPVEVAVLSAAVIGQSSSSSSQSNDDDTSSLLADFLTKLQRQRVLEMTATDGKKSVSSVNYERLEALKERYLSRVPRLFPGGASHPNNIKTESEATEERPLEFPRQNNNNSSVHEEEEEEKSLVECILSLQSAKERENKRISEEIHQLLSKPTAKELSLVEQFRSAAGSHVQEFCQHGTREDCRRVKLQKMRRSSGSAGVQPPNLEPCPKLHFVKIIQKHTDESLGDCSFLNTCFHMESCKYVHYRVEVRPKKAVVAVGGSLNFGNGNSLNNSNSNQHHHNSKASTEKRIPAIKEEEAENEAGVSSSSTTTALAVVPKTGTQSPTMTATASAVPLAKTLASATEQPFKRVLFPPQWIKCDLRYFDMSILGKFAIIMADPPWDIHMELPYGTMSDDEMRKLNIPSLQDEGIIFLWVTGRAMELGRECLQLWGYERCDELIWVKTNQLQRIIRTGRTGHWINHGKEHCLVGVKGRPKNLNRGLDCDVIVAEVRATSHKPDEVYGIIERLSPGTRKIELFGRQHNTQPNWVTLGNQLTGLEIVDPALVEQYKRLYPEDAKKFGVL